MTHSPYRPGQSKRQWFNLDYEEGQDAADVYLYDDIGMWGTRAADFIEQVNTLGAKNLNVYINSRGGEIDDGVSIYNFLSRFAGEVTVFVDGIAASIASIIAMAGDKIIMPDSALMFIHNPWTIMAGDADDLQKEADNLNKRKAALVAVYAKKTGLDSATIEKLMDDETLLTAKEAVEMKFATSIENEPEVEAHNFLIHAVQNRLSYALARKIVTEKNAMTDEPEVKNEVAPEEEEVVAVDPVTCPECGAEFVPGDKAEEKEDEPEVNKDKEEVIEAQASIDRSEFARFCDRFGDVRAAAYFKEGLSFDVAERRFTDELIAENNELRGKQPAKASAGPAPVKPSDSIGSLWDQYNAITDARAKTEFYRKHKNQMSKSTK
jgi:ATP-dependent Clp endopeptidase proteolytic subunit ClpP